LWPTRIRRALAADRTFSQTKTSKGRSIQLAPNVVESLKRHRKRQLEEKAKLGNLWKENSPVFASQVVTACAFPSSRSAVGSSIWWPR